MNGSIAKLAELTYQLFTHLQSELPISLEEREFFIGKVEDVLESRNRIIKELKSPIKSADKTLALEIVKMNKEIEYKLQALTVNVKDEIDYMNYKKKINRKYDPYEGPTIEGVFFDKRSI